MKLVFKLFILILLILIILVSYLSIIGVETDRFNNQIEKKVQNINEKTEIELKKIRLILNPLKLKLNVKTVGSKLKNQNGEIEIESLKTQISLRSLIENKFSIENLEISTKSLEITNLIAFIRSFKNTP